MTTDRFAEDDSSMSRKARELTDHALDTGLIERSALERARTSIAAGRDRMLEGARLVVRAWRDPGFEQRLLHESAAALAEMGLAMGKHGDGALTQELRVVANTDTLHNVIVCTLCSCYPRAILGPPPDWYTSQEYRSRVVLEPREVLKEFGLDLPQRVGIRVWDSTAETRYMVLPEAPVDVAARTDEELLSRITSDLLIGTARDVT